VLPLTPNNALYVQQQVDVNLLYNYMSFYLRVEVAKFLGRDTLTSVKLLAGCSTNFLDVLAVLLQQANHTGNQVIFTQGEPATDMFILQRCAPRLHLRAERRAASLALGGGEPPSKADASVLSLGIPITLLRLHGVPHRRYSALSAWHYIQREQFLTRSI